MYYNIHEFPDRVTRGEDGVYRWKYRMNPRRNKHSLIIMGEVFLIMAVLSTVALLIVGSPNPGKMSNWDMPLMVDALFLGMFLLIAGILFLVGDDPLPFSMDEEKIITYRSKTAGPHTFARMRKVKLLPQYDAIRLGLGVVLYIPPEDYEDVKSFLLAHLPPDADVR